jgi:hypothetical protein
MVGDRERVDALLDELITKKAEIADLKSTVLVLEDLLGVVHLNLPQA